MKFYITTAIDYINAPPHIGHAQEKIIADVIARYWRQKHADVFFLTGTDENGQKNARKARELGITPQELADKNSSLFREMQDILGVSYDFFVRTSDKKIHWPGAQKLWEEMEKRGDIYKKEYEGYYCVGCESFVTEKDLVDGLCPEHKRPPEKIHREINYFFRRTRYLERIKELIEKDQLKVIPEKRKNEVLSILSSEELGDLSVSRPADRLFGWGIPVPGDSSQIMYVWVDALSNYISAIGYGRDQENFEYWWPAQLHVIGKGIARFHAIDWIAFLLSANLPLPEAILVHDYVTVDGQKISKSLGNTIDPIELAKKYGQDTVRYFLLREGSIFEDYDFTYERLRARYEGELQHGIGNLVQRVKGIALKRGAVLKGLEGDIFAKEIESAINAWKKHMEGFEFHLALETILSLCSKADVFIDKERVWEMRDPDLKKALGSLRALLESVAFMLSPLLPTTSQRIYEVLEAQEETPPLFPALA